MKVFSLLSLISLSFFISCSSSSDDNPVEASNYFNLKYEGATATITQFQAVRSEKTIAVTAVAEDGLGIAFEFNELGDIGDAYTYPTSSASSSIYDLYSNYRHYASNYFTFNLINLDSQAKTIEVSFSGNLYEDQYVLEGTPKFIEGSFKVNYTDVTPIVAGLNFSANFNGTTFLSSAGDNSGGFFSGSDIDMTFYNASPYTITLSTNHDNTTTGTYNFTSNSSVNNVILSKYDIPSESYIDYNTTGTLIISEKIVGLQYTIISGTYNFVATNPNDNSQISVSNGSFKTVYNSY